MKPPFTVIFHSVSTICAWLTAMWLISPATADGQTMWTGTADTNWSNANNWLNNTPPTGLITDEVRFTNTSAGSLVSVGTATTLGVMIFGAPTGSYGTGVPAFTISGADLTVVGINYSGSIYGVYNNSSVTQTVSNNLILPTTGTQLRTNANSGGLVLNGNITNGASGTKLTVASYAFGSTNAIRLNGVLSGAGNVNFTGNQAVNNSSIYLNGANTYTGTTAFSNAILYIGTNSVLGQAGAFGVNTTSITVGYTNYTGNTQSVLTTGNYTVGQTFVFASTAYTNNTTTFGTTVAGVSTFSGDFLINSGAYAAQSVNVTATASSRVNFNGHFYRDASATGTADTLIKTGSGVVALNSSSNYAGTTTVSAGTLLVNGTLLLSSAGSGVLVNSGTTLGGKGTINRSVTVNAGATLSPGDMNDSGVSQIGRLVVGDLNLAATTVLNFDLGGAQGANDFIWVNGDSLAGTHGNLLLDGVLNITNGGYFGAGNYKLFSYNGTLTDSGLTFGTKPAGYDYQINVTDEPGSVYLQVAQTGFAFTPVPEPSGLTLLLLTLTSGALLFRRRLTNAMRTLSLLVVGMAMIGTTHAIDIASYSATLNNRIDMGFTTSTPLANDSTSFVGAGYDWSAVGWNAANTTDRAGRVQGFTMISPLHAYSAWHYSLTNAGSGTSYYNVSFLNSLGNRVNATLSGTTVNPTISGYSSGTDDVRISSLTSSLKESDSVSVMRVLDISSGNYVGQSVLVVGSSDYSTANSTTYTNFNTGQLVATSKVSYQSGSSIGLTTNSTDASVSLVAAQSGDSGSPILITYKGQLTIAGAWWYPTSGSTLLANGSYNPTAGTNAVLAADGYALKWTVYDVASDTANTANRWTGGAGSGSFSSTGNWSLGAAPGNKPVVFDAGSAGGQTAINLGGNQSLRGMLFAANTGATGFTFATGNTITLGATGIRNEDNKTQTFNNAFTLADSQNWEAANGDLIFNGAIANAGYLVVVGGSANTTFGGALSGTGGLAKDDAGILVMTAASSYTGKTFIHNGSIKVGVTNALPTGTKVLFDAANPYARLDLNGNNQTVGDVSSLRDGTGLVILDGGNLTTGGANTSSSYSGTFSGYGGITKTGAGTWALLGASQNYSGTFTVSGGTVRLIGSLGNAYNRADVVVASGSSLTGTGTAYGGLTLNSGGSIAPGDGAIGSIHLTQGLTWNGGGQMLLELGSSNSSDCLDLGTGILKKGSAGSYLFTLSNVGGWSEGTYTLMTFGSTDFLASDFSLNSISGYTGNFTVNSNSLTLQLQAVPEPSLYSMLLTGLICLGQYRRRK